MSGIDDQMGRSSADFLRLVWPEVGLTLGRLVPVESVTDSEFARLLDRRAGVDQWIVCRDGHLRGLASRVQWPERGAFCTWTVRVRSRYGGPTEYHKRKAELATEGAVRPALTCQAYVSADRTRLLGAAVTRTSDLIRAVDLGLGRLMRPNADGTQGYAVGWDALSGAGAWVVRWP